MPESGSECDSSSLNFESGSECASPSLNTYMCESESVCDSSSLKLLHVSLSLSVTLCV